MLRFYSEKPGKCRLQSHSDCAVKPFIILLLCFTTPMQHISKRAMEISSETHYPTIKYTVNALMFSNLPLTLRPPVGGRASLSTTFPPLWIHLCWISALRSDSPPDKATCELEQQKHLSPARTAALLQDILL